MDPLNDELRVTPDLIIAARDLEERFVRASGPGGQNVNKVATAVELRFDLEASTLPAEVKDRLRRLANTRLDADGRLLIDSRAFRTQLQNRKAARLRLASLIRQALVVPKTRRKSKPTAASREARLTTKKRHGLLKASRRSADRERGE